MAHKRYTENEKFKIIKIRWDNGERIDLPGNTQTWERDDAICSKGKFDGKLRVD